MATTEAGQERHSTELGEMVARIQQLEKENEGLKSRLDGVLAAVDNAHSKAFPDITKPGSYLT